MEVAGLLVWTTGVVEVAGLLVWTVVFPAAFINCFYYFKIFIIFFSFSRNWFVTRAFHARVSELIHQSITTFLQWGPPFFNDMHVDPFLDLINILLDMFGRWRWRRLSQNSINTHIYIQMDEVMLFVSFNSKLVRGRAVFSNHFSLDSCGRTLLLAYFSK